MWPAFVQNQKMLFRKNQLLKGGEENGGCSGKISGGQR